MTAAAGVRSACFHVADAIASRNQLVAELLDNGHTVRQLAEWAEVSPQTVLNWANAHRGKA